jgi:hypothetical protein
MSEPYTSAQAGAYPCAHHGVVRLPGSPYIRCPRPHGLDIRIPIRCGEHRGDGEAAALRRGLEPVEGRPLDHATVQLRALLRVGAVFQNHGEGHQVNAHRLRRVTPRHPGVLAGIRIDNELEDRATDRLAVGSGEHLPVQSPAGRRRTDVGVPGSISRRQTKAAARAGMRRIQPVSISSIRYPSGSFTKHSREPPSRIEYGGFSGSMPCSARRASDASRSSLVIAMWP